jgi:hypothetical protein
MANNSISRTGTFTSSGSAGGSGTYHYNHGENWSSSGSSGYSGVDYYSNDDFKNSSIFANTDSKISVTFSQELDNSSVTVFNKDIELPFDLQNKKGTIGLTHIVSSTLGATTDDNNLKALKLTSIPISITDNDHSDTANQEFVEMASVPSTVDNKTYVFTPKANLSSNTTYFLRMDPTNVLDSTGAKISYDIERGFVTDNSQSFVTTKDYYDGFSIQIEKVDLSTGETEPNSDGVTGPQFDSLTLYRSSGTVSSATILKNLYTEGTELTYQLDVSSYKMNVAYTATDPIVITNIDHGLADDDKIEVYDVVSGNSVRTGTYTVTELTSDTFSIPLDGTGSDAGRLNYYRNVNKNDLFKWSEVESDVTYTVRKKALSVPRKNRKNIDSDLLEAKITTKATSDGLDDGTISGRIGKIIKVNDNIISFVAVDTSEYGGKITTSAFVNNSIVDISTSSNDIRFHIKANTSPDHNVHPFHSSAPKVVSTFPEDGESFSRKLKITQISRRGAIAIVSTNHPHNLSKDAFIKIVDSTQDIYNKTTKVLLVPTSNTFHYDLGASNDFSNVQSPAPGKPKLQISNDDGTTYAERYNAIFVNFSQSMNTSTVTVSDGTNLVSADGTSAVFAGGQDSASSTIQLSDDGFETIENCVSVTASAGNSVFAIVPETLKARHNYNIKVKTDVQDLGKTNSLYQFTTTEGTTIGIKVVNPQTGQETVYSKDEDPPKIKKISLAGHVLESSDLSEITSPDSYQSLAINPGAIAVQFSESMKINSVTTATSNTDPTGTVLLSADDFSTVVQMTTDPVVTTTDEENDTFTFTPVANLSANAVYTLKILKDVTDDSPEENRMVQDNVSSIKVLTTNSVPASSDNYYSAGEIISGVRTLTIKANIGTPTIGVTAGSTFLGLTSKGKGKVLDFTEDSGAITSIRYTEIASNDGSIRPLSPGEICKVSDTVNFTIDNVAITDPPEGNVVSFTSSTRKLIYRDRRTTNEFVSANSSAERIFGRTSGGEVFASSSGSEGIVGEGFKTTTTTPVANVFFSDGSSLVSPIDGNQTGIDERSNLTVTFNQTMNVESINFNAVDSIVRDSYNILLSYDDSFQNTIPLSTNFTRSNNDTVFEFQPAILSNTSLQLTQNKNLYAKITQTAKNKGDENLASTFSPSNYANTTTAVDFKAINASVFTEDGQEVILGTGSSGSMPNQSTIISAGTPIVIHFNEVPKLSTFAFNSEIELSTVSGFSSLQSACSSLSTSGTYGTQIMITLSSGAFPPSGAALTSGTRYYLRIGNTVGGTNEGGQALDTTVVYFNSFTII